MICKTYEMNNKLSSYSGLDWVMEVSEVLY
jgi:hypothetical protein